MITAALGIVLLAMLVVFLHQQKVQRWRVAARRDVPHEQLLPHNYKAFTALENELWNATDVYRGQPWEGVRFGHREREFELLNGYLRGLRQDFQQGDRIFGRVILHSPEIDLFAQLESERCRMEASFYVRYALACFHLRTSGVSVKELRRLTELIATLAHRVRTILAALESSEKLGLVDSILRNS
jgi:hypothetical protein